MKKTILYLLSVLLFLTPAYSIKLVSTKSVDSTSTVTSQPVKKLTVKDAESLAGRKLTIKEKIGLLFFNRQLKQQGDYTEAERSKANTNGVLGFVFGILSIFVLPFFAIPGLILSNKAIRAERENPGILGNNKGLAKAGQIINWVGIGLIALTVAIIFIIIAGGGFS